MTIDYFFDHYFTNRLTVQRRLWKHYKRGSEVLHPPAGLDFYRTKSDDGFCLHLGRLDDEKGVPAVIEAFEWLDERLLLAGGRGDIDDAVFARLRQASNIDYRGFVSEAEKTEFLAACTTVVFNGRNDEFAIVPMEAITSGKLVLTRDGGLLAALVNDGENGYCHNETADRTCQADKLSAVHRPTPSPSNIERFCAEQFRRHFVEAVQSWYNE